MATSRIPETTSTITRRAILAGLPTIITTVGTTALPANASTGADACVIAMIDRWRLVSSEYLPLSDRAPDDSALPAMQATIDALSEERDELWTKIMATRATTPEGMLAKFETHAEPLTEPEAMSVYDDLRALCGLPLSNSEEG